MISIPPSQFEYPAQAAPPGVTPNFINPESTGPILIIVGSILEALMVGFVANRLITKAFITRKFTWDDLTCVIGALFTTAYLGMSIVAVNRCHFGTHQWDLTLGQLYSTDTIFIIEYLSIVLAPPTLLFVKVTFFILFLQLFRPVRSLRVAIYVGLAFTVVFYTVIWILSFVSATPRPGETWLQHETENPVEQIIIKLAVVIPTVGIAIDLYILILPLVGVFGLHLPIRQKIGAGVVFFTAIIAVVASVLALVYRIAIYEDPFNDLTRNQMAVLLTSIVEMSLGVCISCMPAFSHMLRQVLPPLKERISGFSVSKSWSKGTNGGSRNSDRGLGAFVKGNGSDRSQSDVELRATYPAKTCIYRSSGGHTEEDGIPTEIRAEARDL